MLSYLANLSLGRLLPSRAFLRFSSRCKDTLFVVSMLIQFLMVFRQSYQPFLATLPFLSTLDSFHYIINIELTNLRRHNASHDLLRC